MVKTFIVAVCCFSLVMNLQAQDIVFESLNKLPASINTRCEEILPMGSPDGKTLYFARVSCDANTGGKVSGSDIWVSELNADGKAWGNPKNSGIVFNDKGNNAVVGMSSDGQTIYQINTSPSKKIRGVYFSKQTNGQWSKPELEPIPFLETEEYFGLYVASDFRTIIVSMKRPEGAGEEDLYVSRKDSQNKWSPPVNLGAAINSIGFEISPFLTADTKRLYFASNGHRGLGGSDIFYSNRLDDSWTSWSAPVNLGNVVNTEGFDAYFMLSNDVAWFSSSDGVSSEIYSAKVRKPANAGDVQVSSIVAEASSMLADLTDDTYDSLSSYTQSVFVAFERNTAELSDEAKTHLDEAVALVRNKKQGKLTLVAYANPGATESGQLWDKRLNEIRTYLRQRSGLDLMIDHEIIKVDMNESAKGSVVEVRYN